MGEVYSPGLGTHIWDQLFERTRVVATFRRSLRSVLYDMSQP